VDRAAGQARLEVRRDLDPIRLDTPERPYHPDQADAWHLYRLITNRSHGPGRPAEFQDVGELVRGSWDPATDDYDSTATWQVDEERRTVRLRIPWAMLGFADPSSRTVLGEGLPAERLVVDDLDLALEADGDTERLTFTWPRWNFTTYEQRPKAGLGVVEEAYRDLAR